MSFTVKTIYQRIWKPQLISVRQKSKVRISDPRPPHFERSIIENLAVPYFKKTSKPQHVPDDSVCEEERMDKRFMLNPYEEFLVKNAKNWFKNAKLIAFFHVNYMEKEELFQNKLELKKIGMRYFVDGKKIMENALFGTIYENALVLFQSHTAYAVGVEPDLAKLLNVTKKLTKITLLGALVENRLLNVSEINYLGSIKNIEEARVKLLSILNTAPQNLMQQIQHHPSNLVQLLNIHQDELKNTEKPVKK